MNTDNLHNGSVRQTILTPERLADYLGMSVTQVYSMTCKRGRARMARKLPVLRINGNLRFSQSAVDQWLRELEQDDREALWLSIVI